MRALAAPAPAAAAKPDEGPTPNYRPADRQQLDRVIGTQQ
jgi:hypothetical protein